MITEERMRELEKEGPREGHLMREEMLELFSTYLRLAELEADLRAALVAWRHVARYAVVSNYAHGQRMTLDALARKHAQPAEPRT